MGIKTEDMYKNLPPKVITEGVDWLGILDAFDPTKLEDRFINECARRNPYDTGYVRSTNTLKLKRGNGSVPVWMRVR